MEPPAHRSQRSGNGKRGRGQEFPQHQDHERPLTGGQGLEVVSSQIVRDQMVQPVFALRRRKRLHDRQPFRVAHIRQHLAAQRALTERSQAGFQPVERRLVVEIGELLLETFEVAEDAVIHDADQSIEFEQRVLQGRSGKEELGRVFEGLLQGIGDDVGRFVDVSQPVGFVDHDKVPTHETDLRRLATCELVGADDDLAAFERADISLPDGRVVELRLQNPTGQEEFLLKFLMPLFAKIGWRDDEHATLPLCPFLREHQPGLDGLAESDFVREKCPLRERRPECEQRGFNLMGIEVHLRIHQRAGELLDTVRRTTLGQFMGEVLGVIVGKHTSRRHTAATGFYDETTVSGGSSHFLQFKTMPRCCARPSSVVTQGRLKNGGWCRTCCPWPQAKSATQ